MINNINIICFINFIFLYNWKERIKEARTLKVFGISQIEKVAWEIYERLKIIGVSQNERRLD